MAGRRVIGVDLGGTKILAAVIDLSGRIERQIERPTPVDSQDEMIEAVVGAVLELRTGDTAAVGFGVPARIDSRTGVALGAVNTPLGDIVLEEVLARRIGLPVGVINDGSAAALAEFLHGAGRGTRNLVLLTLGTGVGGGLILEGQLYRGWSEVGHMVIVEDGEPCQGACTGNGHVESYCSGNAADRLAREVLGPDATAYDLVEQRHPALRRIGRHLGAAVSSLVNLFDPDVVVIGGGFGVAAGSLLLDPAREVISTEALSPAGTSVRVAVAELGSAAGVIGAGLVAFEALD
ncbi:MAG TPA: ROK family protein [Gaiellaceae bacterium]|nr:ROK family protein [Gaiellaceae bacterium]